MAKPTFVTGDVFWAPDPYHNDDPYFENDDARPWVVVNTDRYPDHGHEYICCALTSYKGDHEQLIRLAPDDWAVGTKREGSQLDPTTVFTIHHEWSGKYLGRIAPAKVNAARNRIKGYL